MTDAPKPGPQGTFACPICRRDTPHNHSDADKAAWRKEEIEDNAALMPKPGPPEACATCDAHERARELGLVAKDSPCPTCGNLEAGNPPEGSRLWRCENELRKARAQLAAVVDALRAMREALEAINAWDMINPPSLQTLADGPWIKMLVTVALAALPPDAEKKKA